MIAPDLLGVQSTLRQLPLVQLHWLVIQRLVNEFFFHRLLVVQRHLATEASNSVEVSVKVVQYLDL